MPRLDVFRNPAGAGYLLDVQAELLDDLTTRVVVPLLPKAAAPPPIGRLNPVFVIDATEHVMAAQLLAAVPTRILRAPVTNLEEHHVRVVAALDVLITGT